MAIVKSAGLRNYVGKHAGNVYYLQKGEALVREKAAEVTNPRTPSQMMQRTRLANLVNFYRANKEWMKRYAYETLGKYFSIYNQFVSLNLNPNSVPLSKGEAKNGVVLPDNLVLTKGTLPTIGPLKVSELKKKASSNIRFNKNINYIGELSTALIARGDEWKEGDQLSAVLIGYQNGKQCAVKAVEMILNSESTENLPEIIDVYDNYLSIDMNQFDTLPDNGFGVAFIHSRRENGKILVSSENLSLSATAIEIIGAVTTEEANQRAIDSYAAGNDAFLDPGSNVFQGIIHVTKEITPNGGGNIYGPDIVFPGGKVPTYYIKPAQGYKISRYDVDGSGREATTWEKENGITVTIDATKDFTIKATFVSA